MATVKLGKEIVIKVRNEIGVLNELTRVIADRGINVLAVHGSVEGENGIIRIVTEDNLRAVDALREKDYRPQQGDVVLVEMPHKAGMLRKITDRLAAEGIDIHHLYATAGQEQNACLVVFQCSNNDRAVVAVSKA